MKTVAVSIGLFLLACLVFLAFVLWDESRYRTCIEDGGVPRGRELTIDETMERAIGEAPRMRCARIVDI